MESCPHKALKPLLKASSYLPREVVYLHERQAFRQHRPAHRRPNGALRYDCSFVATHSMGPPNPDLLKPFPTLFNTVTCLCSEINTDLNYTSVLKRYMRLLDLSIKLSGLSVVFCTVNCQGLTPGAGSMGSLMQEWPSYRLPMRVDILYHYLWAWLFEELPGNMLSSPAVKRLTNTF